MNHNFASCHTQHWSMQGSLLFFISLAIRSSPLHKYLQTIFFCSSPQKGKVLTLTYTDPWSPHSQSILLPHPNLPQSCARCYLAFLFIYFSCSCMYSQKFFSLIFALYNLTKDVMLHLLVHLFHLISYYPDESIFFHVMEAHLF